jgi:hypothetical protein
MAVNEQADPWALHRESGYLPGQPGYISTLSAREMFGPLNKSKKRKWGFELNLFTVAMITAIVIAAIAITIFLLKHYRII